MAITLTEAAAQHVQRYLAKRGKGVGVRLGVQTTGCSGLAYKLEYVDEVAPEDIVFESHGVKVLVDPKSLPYIDGTELDFVREGLNEGFKFNNPQREGPLRLRRKLPRLSVAADGPLRTLFHEPRRQRLRAVRPAAALRAGPRRARARWTRAAGARCIPTASRARATPRGASRMQWSMRVNEAYQRLKDPLQRARLPVRAARRRRSTPRPTRRCRPSS